MADRFKTGYVVNRLSEGFMDSVVNLVMLICAVVAALAAGVLLGYVTCKGLFGLCSMHVRALVAAKAQAEVQTVNA